MNFTIWVVISYRDSPEVRVIEHIVEPLIPEVTERIPAAILLDNGIQCTCNHPHPVIGVAMEATVFPVTHSVVQGFITGGSLKGGYDKHSLQNYWYCKVCLVQLVFGKLIIATGEQM